MGQHLDWLQEAAGRRAARNLVDETLARLRRQLLRLQSQSTSAELGAVAAALRDCGAQIGNGDLARDATRLLDDAHRSRRRLQPLVRRLTADVQRTSSWLRMWLTLSTPVAIPTHAADGRRGVGAR